MEKQKHTPEPWATGQKSPSKTFSTSVHLTTASASSYANADRIVACVNACAGIANPAAIPAAIEALERSLPLLIRLGEYEGIDSNGERRNLINDARAALAALKGE